ncbi:hypothetical protein FVE85_1543 [Porphyridium purpureum]|uniref:F-box domain-containing protein n=1 Tax=Porphyridium purpureum TaxID=35688 RepID=A0A5J4YW33_PORPP|nr:hypothetical protein FVE85_1543 [Porphyridium purpureum]|eukprot:POR1041..scf209_3
MLCRHSIQSNDAQNPQNAHFKLGSLPLETKSLSAHARTLKAVGIHPVRLPQEPKSVCVRGAPVGGFLTSLREHQTASLAIQTADSYLSLDLPPELWLSVFRHFPSPCSVAALARARSINRASRHAVWLWMHELGILQINAGHASHCCEHVLTRKQTDCVLELLVVKGRHKFRTLVVALTNPRGDQRCVKLFDADNKVQVAEQLVQPGLNHLRANCDGTRLMLFPSSAYVTPYWESAGYFGTSLHVVCENDASGTCRLENEMTLSRRHVSLSDYVGTSVLDVQFSPVRPDELALVVQNVVMTYSAQGATSSLEQKRLNGTMHIGIYVVRFSDESCGWPVEVTSFLWDQAFKPVGHLRWDPSGNSLWFLDLDNNTLREISLMGRAERADEAGGINHAPARSYSIGIHLPLLHEPKLCGVSPDGLVLLQFSAWVVLLQRHDEENECRLLKQWCLFEHRRRDVRLLVMQAGFVLDYLAVAVCFFDDARVLVYGLAPTLKLEVCIEVPGVYEVQRICEVAVLRRSAISQSPSPPRRLYILCSGKYSCWTLIPRLQDQ